jgi:hypothetical protein
MVLAGTIASWRIASGLCSVSVSRAVGRGTGQPLPAVGRGSQSRHLVG